LGLSMVLPKSRNFLWVFSFFKSYSLNYPTQPTILGGFNRVYRGSQSSSLWVHPFEKKTPLLYTSFKILKIFTRVNYKDSFNLQITTILYLLHVITLKPLIFKLLKIGWISRYSNQTSMQFFQLRIKAYT